MLTNLRIMNNFHIEEKLGPLLITHQMSQVVWVVCSLVIHWQAKRATKHIDRHVALNTII